MSSPKNNTEVLAPTQEEVWNEEQWQQLLRDRMPEDWQEQAIRTKAWQRTRKLACIGDLLRALLVYAANGYSFRQLGIWATALGLGSLSERAWRKRVARAGDWMVWLMGALIGTQATPGWIRQGLGRILLIDATRLKLPAGTGDDMRLHCAYDLRAGRLAHVEISDCHGAEGLHHFELQAGDIVVTDSGYPRACMCSTGTTTGSIWGPSGKQPSGSLRERGWSKNRFEAIGQASRLWNGDRTNGLDLGLQTQRAHESTFGD